MTAPQPETPKPDEPVVDDEAVGADDAATAADASGDVPQPESAPTGGPAEPAAGEDAPEVDAEPAVEEEPDWKDRYLRSVAELDNVRKRARRDAAAGEVRGVVRLAKELLPAMDNLDRAIQHIDETGDGDAQIVEGLRIVHREMHAALAQAGIEAYDPTGEEFDPRFHEAMTTAPAEEGVLPGTVTITYQVGYRRGEDVLRAARVVVAG